MILSSDRHRHKVYISIAADDVERGGETTREMKNKFSLLRGRLMKDLLGERVKEYENFSKDRKRPHKRKHRQLIPLWKFILHLLHRDVDSKYVEWSKENPLQFQIKDPTSVAELWGSMKYKSDMTYEKLARAMRYYYGKDIIEKVSGKRYSYRFVLSNKTKICITKLMDINGSTFSRIQTLHDSTPEVSTDDDTASISSLTSYESNSSSVCSIPDQDQQSPYQKSENEDTYEEPLLHFSSAPLQEHDSSSSLAVPSIRRVFPSNCPQQNKTENPVNRIKKSNITLQNTNPGYNSAFSPPNKTTCVDARNEIVQGTIIRGASENSGSSENDVAPYTEFRSKLPFNHGNIVTSTIYVFKQEPGILTNPVVGNDDDDDKKDVDSSETEIMNIIPNILESAVGITELNANDDTGPCAISNSNNSTSKRQRKDPFMGCADGRNENLAECPYSCDVFGDFC